MRIIKPYYEILKLPSIEDLKILEDIGRTCYKSQDKITEDSYKVFCEKLIKSNHGAMLEFADIIVRFYNDRGVSHEEVRHRLCSFAQESTRYCNYHKDKFGNEITIIDITPHLKNPLQSFDIWFKAMNTAEFYYLQMLEAGESPQIARSVLPNSLKTEINIKANLREWRWIFHERTPITAHPQMREVMVPLLKELKEKVPVIFDDIPIIEEG